MKIIIINDCIIINVYNHNLCLAPEKKYKCEVQKKIKTNNKLKILDLNKPLGMKPNA